METYLFRYLFPPLAATLLVVAACAPIAQQAVDNFRTAAESGDAEAQYVLGNYYRHGSDEFAQDSFEAMRWYDKAAEQEYDLAQYELGSIYFVGEIATRNETHAMRRFRQAAELGHSDSERIVKFPRLREAAEQGDAEAQFLLGKVYCTGSFFGYSSAPATEATREGVTLIRRAAEQGDVEAQYELGAMYDMKSCGIVAENEREAMRWYCKAAIQGDERAQSQLAEYSQTDIMILGESDSDSPEFKAVAFDCNSL